MISLFSGEGDGTPLQYFCLENPMDGGAWQAAVHAVAKSRTRLSDFAFTFHFHALEKEMATCSSVLAWRIPGTGEPGGLPSLGSHRVGHDWSDLAAVAQRFHTLTWNCDVNVQIWVELFKETTLTDELVRMLAPFSPPAAVNNQQPRAGMLVPKEWKAGLSRVTEFLVALVSKQFPKTMEAGTYCSCPLKPYFVSRNP